MQVGDPPRVVTFQDFHLVLLVWRRLAGPQRGGKQ
jgi:hypothetical protein